MFVKKFNPKDYKYYRIIQRDPRDKNEELFLDFLSEIGVKKDELVWFREQVHVAWTAPDIIFYIHRDLVRMVWDFLEPVIQAVSAGLIVNILTKKELKKYIDKKLRRTIIKQNKLIKHLIKENQDNKIYSRDIIRSINNNVLNLDEIMDDGEKLLITVNKIIKDKKNEL